jgi:hypothetical protein
MLSIGMAVILQQGERVVLGLNQNDHSCQEVVSAAYSPLGRINVRKTLATIDFSKV